MAFIDPETLIPADHPLRTIKRFADAVHLQLSPLFDEMYAADGQGVLFRWFLDMDILEPSFGHSSFSKARF